MAAALLAVCLLVLAGMTGPAKAAFSGINGEIAFVSDRSGNNEIYIIWFNGNTLDHLTHLDRSQRTGGGSQGNL